MKKMFIGLLACLLLVGCSDNCILDGKTVCLSESEDSYLIEPEATLKMAVETEEYGDSIVQLWNRTYPENSGAVTYVVYENFDVEEYHDNYTDIAMLWDVYAISIENEFTGVSDYLYEDIKDDLPGNFMLHTRYNKYLPLSAIGSVFTTNLTLLEEHGIDVSDINDDGLVDAVSSFEKIAELDFETLMHFYPDDYYTAYVIGTNGFNVFENHDPYEPGFDSDEFYSAMVAAFELSDIMSTVDNFIYPSDLGEADVPFLISIPTMMIKEEEASNGVNYSFSKFPDYNGSGFTPLANSKGYLLSADCQYYSAANALLELIYSDEGKQLYLDNTESYMVCNDFDEYDYHSNNRQEISRSYLDSYLTDFSGYADNEYLKSGDLLEDTEYFDVVRQVYRQELNAEQAQKIMLERAEDWYMYNNLLKEYVTEE